MRAESCSSSGRVCLTSLLKQNACIHIAQSCAGIEHLRYNFIATTDDDELLAVRLRQPPSVTPRSDLQPFKRADTSPATFRNTRCVFCRRQQPWLSLMVTTPTRMPAAVAWLASVCSFANALQSCTCSQVVCAVNAPSAEQQTPCWAAEQWIEL